METDGRRLRAIRTREAILDALLALVDAGELQPTVPQIAAKAGVAERSIRQHFSSRDEIFLAGAAKHFQRAAQLHVAPKTTGALAARLDAFVEARVAYLEATANVRRSAMMHAPEWPLVRTAIRALSLERRMEIEAAFAPEVKKHTAHAREELIEALHVAASGAIWDAMRRDLEMTAEAAQKMLRRSLHALLTA
jgi:AcrR family transcriptional regulator